jgi:hypothetical protein
MKNHASVDFLVDNVWAGKKGVRGRLRKGVTNRPQHWFTSCQKQKNGVTRSLWHIFTSLDPMNIIVFHTWFKNMRGHSYYPPRRHQVGSHSIAGYRRRDLHMKSKSANSQRSNSTSNSLYSEIILSTRGSGGRLLSASPCPHILLSRSQLLQIGEYDHSRTYEIA